MTRPSTEPQWPGQCLVGTRDKKVTSLRVLVESSSPAKVKYATVCLKIRISIFLQDEVREFLSMQRRPA